MVEEKKRSNKGNPAWVAGVSGNPNGRKKTDPELKAAFEAACPDAVAALVKIVRRVDDSTKDGDVIKAAQIIIERVMGKPIQTVETNQPIHITPERSRELIARAVRHAREHMPELLREETPEQIN